jgi:hypothetical protein
VQEPPHITQQDSKYLEASSELSDVSFRLFGETVPRGRDDRLELSNDRGEKMLVVELPGHPIDVLNAELPWKQSAEELRALREIPRMSTFTIGSLLNLAVSRMPVSESFVNVGVWKGFSFLAGLLGNHDKACVGIDDFSGWGGPRDTFMEYFRRFRGPKHDFHEMDYRRYFEKLHDGPIGVYFYDGDHSYENQWRGLELAEPFLADGALVFVDDTNRAEPRVATLDFAERSNRSYRLLLDRTTAGNMHPTFWNGLMVLSVHSKSKAARSIKGSVVESTPSQASASEPSSPGGESSPLGTYRGLTDDVAPVSLVLQNERTDLEVTAAAIEAGLHQTWPNVEVIVVDESGDERVAKACESMSDRVKVLTTGRQARHRGLATAIQRCRGAYIAFADAQEPLPSTALQLAVAFPRETTFSRGRLSERERATLEMLVLVADDLARAIPPEETCMLLWGRSNSMLPQTLQSRKLTSVNTAAKDPAEVLKQLEEKRLEGTRYAAVISLSARALWHDSVLQRLATIGKPLLTNEHVAVYDVRR